jgi:TolA-binding protein
MLKHITAAVVVSLMMAGPVIAQTKTRPEGKPAWQKTLMAKRIRQGVRSGTLTKDDVAQIRQQLQAFRAEVKQMRQSGALTKADKQTLRQEWRRISRSVFWKKHRSL